MLLLLVGCAQVGLEGGVWQVLDPLPGQLDRGCDPVFAVGPLEGDMAALVWLDDCGGFDHSLEWLCREDASYLVATETGGLGIGWPFRWEQLPGELRIWDDAVQEIVLGDEFKGTGWQTVVGLEQIEPATGPR